MGAFQIAAGWCVHQAGKTAVAGERTNHSCERKEAICNAPQINLSSLDSIFYL